MKLYKATIEILLSVPDDIEGEIWCADAVSEIMRDTQERHGQDLLDWQWAPSGNGQSELLSGRVAIPTNGLEFEEFQEITAHRN